MELRQIRPPNKAEQKAVAALRSGKYKQGHHLLCGHGCHCILGVINEAVEGEQGWHEREDMEQAFEYRSKGHTSRIAITHDVQRKLGWSDTTGWLVRPINGHPSLLELNDRGYMDFIDLAHVIASGWVKLDDEGHKGLAW